MGRERISCDGDFLGPEMKTIKLRIEGLECCLLKILIAQSS